MSESDNKVNGKLDFSNVKQSQLNSGQTLKGSFSELQSALRTYDTNVVLKDAYTHFTQVTDVDGNPVNVEYFQAIAPTIQTISTRSDIAGDLAGEYITFEEYISKKTISFYFVVSGLGTAPGISDEEYPVVINTNDPGSVVAISLINALNNVDSIEAKRVAGYLSNKAQVIYQQFGEANPFNMHSSGFTTVIDESGESFKVGEAFIEYDVDSNPIYNGNTLKGFIFNPYTASFEALGGSGQSGAIATEVQTINQTIALKDTEQTIVLPDDTKRFTLQARDRKTNLQLCYEAGQSNTSFMTVRKGGTLSENDLDLVGTSIYLRSDKDNTIIELTIWK